MKRFMALLSIVVAVLCWVAPTTEQVSYQGYDVIDQQAVSLIRCPHVVGTGVVVGPHTILTAAHVVGEDSTCEVARDEHDRYPISADVVAVDRQNDFAILRTRHVMPVAYRVNCRGYVAGQTYHGAGYPRGASYRTDDYTALGLTYTVVVEGPVQKFHALQGQTVEGMSGGPIINDRREVVGIINAKFIHGQTVLSKELQETQVCRGAPTDK